MTDSPAPPADSADVEAIARVIWERTWVEPPAGHPPIDNPPWESTTPGVRAMYRDDAEGILAAIRSRGWRPPAPAPTLDHDGRPASAPQQWLAWLLDEIDTEVWTSIQSGDGDGDAVCVLADVRTRLARMLDGEIPVPPLAGSRPAPEALLAQQRAAEDTPLTEEEQRAHDRRTGLLRAQGRLPREDYTVEDMEADGDDA